MKRVFGSAIVAVALAAGSVACDKAVPTTTTPTTTAATTTEAYAGSLTHNGAVSYFFSTSAAGFLTATIKTLSPDNTITVGLALGTWNGLTCQTVIANDAAGQGMTVSGSASGAGTLCVRIYDATGTIAGSTQFELTVVHP